MANNNSSFGPSVSGTYLAGFPGYIGNNVRQSNTYVPGTYLRGMAWDTPGSGQGIAGAGGAGTGKSEMPLMSYSATTYNTLDPNAGMGPFMRGLNRGNQQTQALGYGFAGLTGDLTSTSSLRDWGYEGYLRNMEEAEQYQREVERVEDIDSPSAAYTWAAETLGELVPSAATALVSGGVGAVAARTVGAKLLQKAAASAITKKVSSGVAENVAAKEVMQRLANNVAQGALIASTTILESGSNWGKDVTSHGVEGTSPWMDLAFGAASGISESILGAEGSLLRSIVGKPVTSLAEQSFRRGLISALPTAMLKEGGQEAFQEILSSVNEHMQDSNYNITVEDISNVMNAAAAGALGGGAMGTAEFTLNRAKTKHEPITAAVDKSAIKNEIDASQPLVKAESENKIMLSESTRIWKEEQDNLNTYYKDRSEKSAINVARLGMYLKELKEDGAINAKPVDAKNIPKLISKYESRLASVLAYKVKLDKEYQLEGRAITDRLNKAEAAAGRKIISASARQAEVNDISRKQAFANDPDIVESINSITDDVAIFANHQNTLLDTRINKIKSALDSVNTALDESIRRSQEDPNAKVVTKETYDYAKKRQSELRAKLKEAIKSKSDIRTLANKIVKDSFTVTDATLGEIGKNVSTLYSLGNVTEDSLKNADLFINGAILAQDVQRERFKEMAASAKAARSQLKAQFGEGNPNIMTADMLLANAEASAESRMHRPTRVPEGYKSIDDLAEQQTKDRELAVEANAAQEQIRASLEKASRLEHEQRIQNAAMEAKLVRDYMDMEATKAFDEVDQQRAENPQPTFAEQEKAQQDKSEQEAMQEIAAVKEQIAAAKTLQERVGNGTYEVEWASVDKKLRDVMTWVQHTLESLPMLKDSTVVASSSYDVRVPVALQNSIFNMVQNGSAHPVGAYFNGKVYIFANAVTDKHHAVRALVHEGVVHFGMRSIFTDAQLKKFLSMVFNSFKGTDQWKKFTELHPEYFTKYDKLRQAEEFVAYIGEQRKASKYISDAKSNNIINTIINFVRNVLASLRITKITEQDIMDVLTASAKYLANSNPDGWYSLQGIEILDQEGQTSTDNNIGSNTIAWGSYFNSVAEAAAFYDKLEAANSGLPGVPYINNPPTVDVSIGLSSTLADQSEYVKELIPSIIDKSDVQIYQLDNGKFETMMFGKKLAEYDTRKEAEYAMNSDEPLRAFTGKQLYDYIADKVGSQKDASQYLVSKGVRGAYFMSNNKPMYVLFAGDDTSTDPFFYKFGHEEPMFMLKPNEEVIIDEDGNAQQKDSLVQEMYVESLKKQWAAQESWITKAGKIKAIGKSVGPDGKIIQHSWVERTIEYFSDQYRRVQVMQRYLKETGEASIDYTTNIYKNLTGLTNRIHAVQLDMWNRLVVPFATTLKNINIDSEYKNGSDEYVQEVYAALDEYVYAKHAAERNAELNKRFKYRRYTDKAGVTHLRKIKDGTSGNMLAPSGITDAQAADIVAKYENIPGFKEAAAQLYVINKTSLNMLINAGIIPKSLGEEIKSTYDYYVPLKNWNDMAKDLYPAYIKFTKSGISKGNKDLARMAKGRSGLPESPVVHSIFQLIDNIAIIENNNISRSLYKLVKDFPDKDLWDISEKKQGVIRIQKGKGSNDLVYRTKEHEYEGEGYKQIVVIDEGGDRIRIIIKDEALAAALRRENEAPTGAMIDFIRKCTRQISMLQTSRNPAFILSNPVRDFETAILNLGNVIADNEKQNLFEHSADIKKSIFNDVFKGGLPKFLYKVIRNPTKIEPGFEELYREYNDFNVNGGHTHMFNMGTFDSTYTSLRKLTREPSNTLEKAKAVFDTGIRYLDDMSDVTENAVRFSVYRNVQKAFESNIKKRAKEEQWDSTRTQREIELAKQKSANISLECTVNFTRKGSGASIFNALYAFSSATIQGSVRIIQNLWRRGDTPLNNAKRVSKYLSLGVAGAMMQGMLCRVWMGDDDDGVSKYDKIPDYIKYGNFIIPAPFTDGGYVKIPLAYGYNVFWTIGAALDSVIQGNKKPTSAAVDILKQGFSSFSPVDPTDEGFTAFIPTIIRPIAQVYSNMTFSGVPIRPEDTSRKIPDSQKFWAKTPEMYKSIASFLNDYSGGSEVEPGLINISPETLEHIVQGYLGGVGRIVTDTIGVVTMPITGAKIPASNVPIVNRFIGEVNASNTSAIYNIVAGQVEQGKNAIKLLKEDPTMSPEKRAGIMQKYRAVNSVATSYSSAQKELSKIRLLEKDLLKKYPSGKWSKEYNSQLQLLEKRKEAIMKRVVGIANKFGVPLGE